MTVVRVEETSIFWCNTGKSVGHPLESAKGAQRYLALVMRDDDGGKWLQSVVVDNSAEQLVTLLT